MLSARLQSSCERTLEPERRLGQAQPLPNDDDDDGLERLQHHILSCASSRAVSQSRAP